MTFYTTPLKQGDFEDIADLPTSTGEYVRQKFLGGLDTIRGALGGVEVAQAAHPMTAEAARSAATDNEYYGEAMGGALPPDFHAAPELPPIARIPMDEAKRRVKEAGLDHDITNLGSAPDIGVTQLDVMMRHARDRRYREAQIARGPSGIVPGTLGLGAEFFGNAIDPVNMAAFSIPVLGEARTAQWLASASKSVLGRLAVRGGIGAAQGAAGTVALQPLDYMAYSADGRDYTFADALQSVATNAGIGGVLHAGGGAIADVWRRRVSGRPLYPFAEGEPFERRPGEPASIVPTGTGAAIPPEPPPFIPPTPAVPPPLSAMPIDTAGGISTLREATKGRLGAGELQRLDDLYARPEYAPDLDQLQERAAAPLDRPITVFRGAKSEEQLFDNASHLSTSDREYPATTFARNLSGEQQGVRAEIRVEPGVRAFVPDSGVNHEVVLARGTRYEITGRGLDHDTGQEVLTVVARPSESAPVPEAATPARIPAGPATWRNWDFESPIEVVNEPPSLWPDGRWYQPAIHEERLIHIPIDEIEPGPRPAKPSHGTIGPTAGSPVTAAETRAADILRNGKQYRIDGVIETVLDQARAARERLADPEAADWVKENMRGKLAGALEHLEKLIAERDEGKTGASRAPFKAEAPTGGKTRAERLREQMDKEKAEGIEPLDFAAVAGQRSPVRPVTPADAAIPSEFRAQPIPGPLPNWIGTFKPHELVVDAARFQFKSGGDEYGVTERLQGITHWNQVASGISVVWQDKDGRFFIVDGHQRLALARRIAAEDPSQRPVIVAYVFRESDRVTARKVRVMGALRNIAEGTGTAVDAAKVLRDEPALVNQLPPRSELVRQARGLANLSPEAFRLVIDEVAPANYAAIVGRLAPKDGDLQRDLLHALDKADPSNVTQAEAVVRQGIEQSRTAADRAGLFTDEAIASALYVERAKILDLAMKDLKRDKVVFAILSRERERIEAAGNTLAAEINEQRLAADARFLHVLQILAGQSGPVSDALAAAARHVRDGGRREDAVRGFVADVRRLGESGDLASLRDGGIRGEEDARHENGPGAGEPAEQPGSNVARDTAAVSDIVHPPVNPATGSDEILPPVESREVLKGAIGSLIQGKPVRAGEQIEGTKEQGKGRRRGKRPPPMTPRDLWQQLASEMLPHRDAEAVEAARAAEAMGEPASVSPEPAVRAKAAEKLGAEAEEQFKARDAFVTTDEEREDRAVFQASLDEQAQERQRKAEVIRQGAACLMSGGFGTRGSPPPASDQGTPPTEPNDGEQK